MSRPGRVAEAVTSNVGPVLVGLLLVTIVLGAGIPMISADVDLEAITGDSAEAQANDYVQDNFTATGQPNTTAVLLVRTGDNTLTRDSLLDSLRLQREIRNNRSINQTFASGDPVVGIENLVAITVMADRLEERVDRLNATRNQLDAGLDEIRTLQREFENDTAGLDENSSTYKERKSRLEADVRAVVDQVTDPLTDAQRSSYDSRVGTIRTYESRLVELEREYGEAAEERSGYKQFEFGINDSYTWVKFGMLQGNYGEITRAASELEDGQPPLGKQIAALEDPNLTRSEYRDHVRDALNGTGPRASDALRLVSASYRPGDATASARMTTILQRSVDDGGLEMGPENETLITAQQHVRHLATGYDAGDGLAPAGNTSGDNATGSTAGRGRYVVFGAGLVEDEINKSMVDTLAIVTPLALLLVVLALSVAYRDPLDILLGLVGITTVLVWTLGLLGWLSVPFNVLLVAVPVLLIGISIDFAVHVIMRHREHRTPADPTDPPRAIRPAMTTAIAGVGIALFWAAATTVIGFFANVLSPLSLIRQFGFASGFGIASALVVFTTLVPALKLTLDRRLEARGLDRHKRAFGTTGRLSRVLSVGETAARRAPLAVIALLVVLTAVSGAAATTVDTTFKQEDFIAHSPPDWTNSLPGPMAPGEYHTADNLNTINQHFRPTDAEAQLLVKGDVNTTSAFRRLLDARETAADTPNVYTLPNGRADIQDPLSVMQTVAEEDDDFNDTFRAADTDNDSIPERNVSLLYDELYEADSDAASQVVHRTPGGEYAAVRLVIGVRGDASYAQTTTAMRDIAATIEQKREDEVESEGENATLTAIATGQSVVNRVIEQSLFETLTRSFVVTLVAVFLVLTVGYRLAGHGATLGAVTLVPVTLSVAWILGTMALLNVPFNVLTVTITSLTIGLGVSYSIHVSARYRLELDRQDTVWDALHTTLTGTGGALLGSVVTTTAAFGTLGLAILPVLAQFGFITAITIVYAFLASVLALPTLLVLWTKYARPDATLRPPDDGEPVEGTAVEGAEAD